MISSKDKEALSCSYKKKISNPKKILKYKLQKNFKENIISKKTIIKRIKYPINKSFKKEIIYSNKNLFYKNKIFLSKKYHYIIHFLLLNLILLFVPFVLSEDNSSNTNEIISILSLTVKGTGNQQILSNNYSDLPTKVFVNGEETQIQEISVFYNDIKIFYIENLTSEQNNVTLKWDYQLTDCSKMFKGLNNIINVDFTFFNFSTIENISMMFYDCQNINYINFNNSTITSVIDMSGLFYNCISLTSLNLSNFINSKVNIIESIFTGCNSLEYLDLSYNNFISIYFSKEIFNTLTSLKYLNLSNVKTNNIDMSYIFSGLNNLISIDLSNFDSSNIINMEYMFNNCYNLIYLDLSNFKIEKAENMTGMFYNCKSLTNLNISKLKTSYIINMPYMFYNCKNLTHLYLSGFNNTTVGNITSIFEGCSSLIFIIPTIFCKNRKFNFFRYI